jgi:hypothetical protein
MKKSTIKLKYNFYNKYLFVQKINFLLFLHFKFIIATVLYLLCTLCTLCTLCITLAYHRPSVYHLRKTYHAIILDVIWRRGGVYCTTVLISDMQIIIYVFYFYAYMYSIYSMCVHMSCVYMCTTHDIHMCTPM